MFNSVQHSRKVLVVTKDPDAEKASDRLWSSDVWDVEAGGDDPPLERTDVLLGDCEVRKVTRAVYTNFVILNIVFAFTFSILD